MTIRTLLYTLLINANSIDDEVVVRILERHQEGDVIGVQVGPVARVSGTGAIVVEKANLVKEPV